MPAVLLDTDTFSEIGRRRNATVLTRAAVHQRAHGAYAISTLTVAEVVKGLHKVQREDRITEFMNRLRDVEVLSLDATPAALGGRIYADLERTGQPIGKMDPLIAAIAIHHNRTLVTGNTRHYQRIIDLGYALKLDDWRGAT